MRAVFAEYCQPHVLFNVITTVLWECKITQKFKYTQSFATRDKKKLIKPVTVYKWLQNKKFDHAWVAIRGIILDVLHIHVIWRISYIADKYSVCT